MVDYKYPKIWYRYLICHYRLWAFRQRNIRVTMEPRRLRQLLPIVPKEWVKKHKIVFRLQNKIMFAHSITCMVSDHFWPDHFWHDTFLMQPFLTRHIFDPAIFDATHFWPSPFLTLLMFDPVNFWPWQFFRLFTEVRSSNCSCLVKKWLVQKWVGSKMVMSKMGWIKNVV